MAANVYQAHVTALDGLVSMNSQFTGVVFVGLALTIPAQHSLENPGACDASLKLVESLLVYECLKLAVCLLKSEDEEVESFISKPKVLRAMMLVTAVATVLGCVFLSLSISTLAQIKVGVVSCGSKPTSGVIATLSIMVPFALMFYMSSVIYAVFFK